MSKAHPLRLPSWLLEFVPEECAMRSWHGLVSIDFFKKGVYAAPIGLNWIFALALAFYRLVQWPAPFAEYGIWAFRLQQKSDALASAVRHELLTLTITGHPVPPRLKAALDGYEACRHDRSD